MQGIAWHILSFIAVGIFLIAIAYRTFAIIKLPIHLRWELAPVPHEKGKQNYGGSYLEEYEWWDKPRIKSRSAPWIYMAKEIFLLRSVWQHNRSLWPFSFSMHLGIYLIVGTLFLQVLLAVFTSLRIPGNFLDVTQGIGSVFAVGSYLLGSFGTISLFIKRTLDANLRSFNTTSRYFNLIFLGAIFLSGAYSWLQTGDAISEMGLFINGLITLDTSIRVEFPLSLHLVISLLFLLYLPMTDMIHFIAKYFTYHEIRWDDEPQTTKMEKELNGLLAQPVTWSASHVKAGAKANWVDVATTELTNEESS